MIVFVGLLSWNRIRKSWKWAQLNPQPEIFFHWQHHPKGIKNIVGDVVEVASDKKEDRNEDNNRQ
jgi:hypothetical protein